MYTQSLRCPLAAQFAQKCAGWFDQAEECTLAFDPSTAHLCRRYETFQNSEIARISKKSTLRCELAIAYREFIEAGGCASRTRIRQPPQVSVLSTSRNLLPNVARSLQRRLPCSSICGSNLSAPLNDKLLGLRLYISLYDLNVFLSRGSPNAQLASSFSDLERRSLLGAFRSFDDAARNSKRTHRVQSDTIPWIVPNDLPGIETASSHYLPILRSLGVSTNATDSTELDRWLPWISLDIASQLNAWPATKSNTMRRTIFRLSQHLGACADAHYPWSQGFSETTAQIPMQALYQFNPSPAVRDAIRAFTSIGLSCINDLMCLHPIAVAHAKNAEKPLHKLFVALDFT